MWKRRGGCHTIPTVSSARPVLRAPLVPLVIALALAACGEPLPPKAAHESDAAPASSLADSRSHGEEEAEEEEPEEEEAPDPTSPYFVSVDEARPPPEPTKVAPPAGDGKGRVTRAECDRAFDKYIELEIAQNPRLHGVPPELIQQAKQMARQQHGDAPCTATRRQYNCAMAATSTAVWQRCMD